MMKLLPKHIDKTDFKIVSVLLLIIYLIALLYIVFPALGRSVSAREFEYSEAGYLVKKTTDNCFHYEFVDSVVANPQFEDHYYFTVFVDDTCIKFEIPYEVFTRYNLGDHVTVSRKFDNTTNSYSEYSGVIYDIVVPAEIVEY